MFGKANWGKFSRLCERKLLEVRNHLSVERMNQEISQSILSSAEEAFSKTSGKVRGRSVPRWNDECNLVVRKRNGAFKLVKRDHNFQHLIDYKKPQPKVRSTVRRTKNVLERFL